jgi:hypothetical protein
VIRVHAEHWGMQPQPTCSSSAVLSASSAVSRCSPSALWCLRSVDPGMGQARVQQRADDCSMWKLCKGMPHL